MTALTKRDLHRRIADAQTEIAAMLLFHVPAKGRKLTASALRALHWTTIRNLVHLAENLTDGFEPVVSCDLCGKAIRPGQYWIADEDGMTAHARCAGVSNRTASRLETARERRRELRKQISKAKELLGRRGVSA